MFADVNDRMHPAAASLDLMADSFLLSTESPFFSRLKTFNFMMEKIFNIISQFIVVRKKCTFQQVVAVEPVSPCSS